MDFWATLLSTVITLIVTLTITFLFNKIIGMPKNWKEKVKAEIRMEEKNKSNNKEIEDRLTKLEEAVGKYPQYRQQSINIQQDLQHADSEILKTCEAIQQGIETNRSILDSRLDRLERREKNSLRAKILNEYRLYTNEHKNPMLAWSEMEHHSFFQLVEDYESLGGNDYVHSTVLPAMNELDVIEMSNIVELKKLYESRKI